MDDFRYLFSKKFLFTVWTIVFLTIYEKRVLTPKTVTFDFHR